MDAKVLPWWNNLWCMQQTVPFALDTGTLSALEILNKLVLAVDELVKDGQLTAQEIEELKARIEAIDQQLKDWSEGKFDDIIENEVNKWVQANVEYIFNTYCKQVFFGLTEDGHFCAFVPKSWREIVFDTGAVYGTPEYGRLILKYSYAGASVPENLYDFKALYNAITSVVEREVGDGLKLEGGKVHVDTGNGLAINPQTKMLEVPIGENLRYTSAGIDVPDADEITKGVVKLTHKVENSNDPLMAVSTQGVYAETHV